MKCGLLQTLLFVSALTSACGQHGTRPQTTPQASATNDTAKDRAVGGACDRCSEMFYAGKPADNGIGSSTTLAQNDEPGERMILEGTVLLPDGKTPAKDIIIYAYHTNAAGLYAPADTQTIGRLNGHLRGWVKTGEDGKFRISTIRPAPYPGRTIPAHVHFLIKEPGKVPYYIDEVWFNDDTLVTPELRAKSEKRGGDQIIDLRKENSTWKGQVKIFLGLNIPGY